MNQILDYTPSGSKRPNGGGKINSDKIVRILAIFLIIFAILLVFIAVYSRVTQNAGKKNEAAAEEEETDAKITVEILEEESKVKVTVSHDKVIKLISYSWDDEKGRDIDVKDLSEYSFDIDLPKNRNKLYINVTDANDHITRFNETIYSENGVDIISPIINIDTQTINGKSMIVIEAKDETEIDFVTYRWDDDDEVKVSVDDVEDNDNRKTIKIELETLDGSHDLLVVATDKAGNNAQVPKTFYGVYKPVIKIDISQDKAKADVTVEHNKGIESIAVKINDGEEKHVDGIESLDEEERKKISFPIDLTEFGNVEKKIFIKATSVDNTSAELEHIVEGDGNTESRSESSETEESGEDNNENIKVSFSNDETEERVVRVKASYDQGIKDIKLSVNGQEFDVQVPNDGGRTMEFPLTLQEGTSKIKVVVIGTDDTQNTVIKNISF